MHSPTLTYRPNPAYEYLCTSRSQRACIKVLTRQTLDDFALMYSSQTSLTSLAWLRHRIVCGVSEIICVISGISSHLCRTSNYHVIALYCLRWLRCVYVIKRWHIVEICLSRSQWFHISAGQTEWATQRLSFKPPATEPLCYLRHSVRLASPAWETHPGLLRIRGNCKSRLTFFKLHYLQRGICFRWSNWPFIVFM